VCSLRGDAAHFWCSTPEAYYNFFLVFYTRGLRELREFFMSTIAFIEESLTGEFSPTHLEVVDESHMHSVRPGSESHFKVVIVSSAFDGKTLIARHRAVNAIVEMDKHAIHALALHTFSTEEWSKQNDTQSPDCLGGFGK